MWGVLAILPVIAGYLYISNDVNLRRESANKDGHRFYFLSAFYGFLLFLISCAIICLLSFTPLLKFVAPEQDWPQLPVNISNDRLAISGLWQFIFSIAAVLSIFLGWLWPTIKAALSKSWGALCENNHIPQFFSKICQKMDIRRRDKLIKLDKKILRDNDLDLLLLHSLHEKIPVLLTLQSGKYYIGHPLHVNRTAAGNNYIRILPLATGVRSGKTQRLVQTADYRKVYRLLPKLREIKSSYDSIVRNKHYSEKHKNKLKKGIIDIIAATLSDMNNKKIIDSIDLDNIKALNEMHYAVVIPYSQIIIAHLFDGAAYALFNSPDTGPSRS